MTMSEHPGDDLPAYALGCLTETENQAVERHLAVCAVCRAEVASLRIAAERMAQAVPQVQPPARVKQAVLARLQPELRTGRKSSPLAWLWKPGRVWGAIALAAFVVLLAGNIWLWSQVRHLSQNTQNAGFQVVRMQGAGTAESAKGVMIVTANGRYGTLVVDSLPVLGEEQQYQLWLIAGGERTSGGVFSVDRWGYGAVVINAPLPLNAYNDFGVTIEPAGGSPGPTGEKVLGGSF